MPDRQYVRTDPGWLLQNRHALDGEATLAVLVVAGVESTVASCERLVGACAAASQRNAVRFLAVRLSDAPQPLHDELIERAHLALVVADHVGAAGVASALAELRTPRLLLFSARRPELRRVYPIGDEAEAAVPQTQRELSVVSERFLARMAAQADGLRRRRPLGLDGGLTATRQRTLRAWEAAEKRHQEVVAASHRKTPDEVLELLHDRQRNGALDAVLVSSLQHDLAKIAAAVSAPAGTHRTALEPAECDAYRQFCARKKLDLGSSLARQLLARGEKVARERAAQQALGADARRSLRHWTKWAALWDAL